MRSYLLTLVGLTGLALQVSPFANAAESKHFPTNEDLRHVRTIARPRLSPDGHKVIVEIADDTASGGKSHVWLIDVDHPGFHQLTYSPDSDHQGERSAEWMPDGDSVLFLAHRGEHTQLFRLPMQAGEAHPFTLKITPAVDESKAPDAIPIGGTENPATASGTSPEGVDLDVISFAVSPDGKTIAIVAHDPQTPGEKKLHDAKADAVLVNFDPHGNRLYLLDPENGKLQSTTVPPDVNHAVWSPHSDRVLAIAEAPNNASDLGPAGTVWIVDRAAPDKATKLAGIPATAAHAAWSQDANSLWLIAQAEQDTPPGYADLYRYDLASNAVVDVSRNLSGSLEGAEPIADQQGGVLAAVQEGTRSTIARFGPQNAPAKALDLGVPVAGALATNARQSGWVYLGQSSTQPATLYFSDRLGSPGKALSTPPLVPADWLAASAKLVQWQSDGRTIQGLIYLPPQSASGRVPLIVNVHGGPLGAWVDDYSPFTNFLLGHGWAVLLPNPRGSTGAGAAFAAANKNDLGGGDYRDIMAGVDAVLKAYPIDADRLGLMGYSYGGEMAGFVEGKTDRFKGIVSGAPVIDQYSEYGTEGGSWYDRWYFGKPWEHAEDAWRQSPLAGTAHAKTPFLLLQGEADTTDPLGQSQEMYRALRQAGVAVQMVQYPREDHGPLYGDIVGNPRPEPWHGFDARQRIVAFFTKCFSSSDANGAKPANGSQ